MHFRAQPKHLYTRLSTHESSVILLKTCSKLSGSSKINKSMELLCLDWAPIWMPSTKTKSTVGQVTLCFGCLASGDKSPAPLFLASYFLKDSTRASSLASLSFCKPGEDERLPAVLEPNNNFIMILFEGWIFRYFVSAISTSKSFGAATVRFCHVKLVEVPMVTMVSSG